MEKLEFIKVAETTDIIFEGKSIGYIQEYLEETVWLELDYNGKLHKGVIKSQLVAMRNVEDYLYACAQLNKGCKTPQKF
jgi:hypothetical protein|tara:strand:- start:383 stop:619 length:237 start_codon:yes stop_codon:yes gene_type:complete